MLVELTTDLILQPTQDCLSLLLAEGKVAHIQQEDQGFMLVGDFRAALSEYDWKGNSMQRFILVSEINLNNVCPISVQVQAAEEDGWRNQYHRGATLR